MKTILPLVSLTLALLVSEVFSAPQTVQLQDGRILDGVTAVTLEQGKVKISHSSGVSRYPVQALKTSSLEAFGINPKDFPAPEVPVKRQIKTLDGVVYEGAYAITATPAFITFIHISGIASVRFGSLDDELRREFGYESVKAEQFGREHPDMTVAINEAEKKLAVQKRLAIAAVERVEAEHARKEAEKRRRADSQAVADHYNSIRSSMEIGAWVHNNPPEVRAYWRGVERERALRAAAEAKYFSHK